VALAGVGTHGTAIGGSVEAGAPSFSTTIRTSVIEAGMVETTTATTPGVLDHTEPGLTDHTPMARTAEGSDPMAVPTEDATVVAVFPVMTAGAIPSEAIRLAIA
jgi:hypothetical protein